MTSFNQSSSSFGSGRTPWDTWISFEESGTGFCWEIDPHTGYSAKTKVTDIGGAYESFAYDNQDPVATRYFTTEDASNGALIRYTPSLSAYTTGSKYDILTSTGGSYDYLFGAKQQWNVYMVSE